MIDSILSYWANPWIAFFLYWLPLSLCTVGYTLRTFENYYKDVTNRDEYEKEKSKNPESMAAYYSPTDTIGTLIGRAIVTIVPICNLWASVFDISPRLFGKLIRQIELIFNQPLVPKRK